MDDDEPDGGKEQTSRTDQARKVVEEHKDDLREIIKKLPKPPLN